MRLFSCFCPVEIAVVRGSQTLIPLQIPILSYDNFKEIEIDSFHQSSIRSRSSS